MFSDLCQGHRSIRKYKPDEIPSDLIHQVLADAVAGGSSSGNLNSCSMILTRDADRKQRLYELHSEQDMVLEAPLVITFCADWYRTRQWLKLWDARDNFNNFLGYHVAIGDAFIVAQNACLGFEAHRLGICYMGTTLFKLREIGEFLELPETCVPVTTIVVGYPNENPKKRDRLPINGLIFEEKYSSADAKKIDEIYNDREKKGWDRYMQIEEYRQFAETRGLTSLAQFYTSEIKYDPDFFAQCTKEIESYLKEKGFL